MKRTSLKILSLALTGVLAMAGFIGCGSKTTRTSSRW